MAIQWGKRIATAVILVPLVIYTLTFESATTFIIWLIAAIVNHEYRTTVCPALLAKCPPVATVGPVENLVLGVVMTAVIFYAASISVFAHSVATSLMLVVIVCTTLLRDYPSSPGIGDVLRLCLDVFGLMWISWSFSYAILVRPIAGMGMQIMVLLCSWMCDSAALIFGSRYGTIKLERSVSPGKTYAGAIGGALSCVVLAVAFHELHIAGVFPTDFLPFYSTTQFAVLGLLTAFFGIVGDLVESFLKRAANLKDSGNLFPGHGGALDRMDSILLTPPVMYYLILYWNASL